MTTAPSPLADADALFASVLQPILGLAAFAARGMLALLGGAVLVLVVGLTVRAASAWRGRRRSLRVSPTTPVSMTRSLTLLAVFLLAAPAFAQTHTDPMARLAAFEGTYALDGEPHQADGSFDGTLTVSPTLGGHFQQWDWEMTMRGEGLEEQTLLRFIVGYDAATGAYTVHRFDSRDADSPTRSAGALDASKGRLQVDGSTLVMAWTMENPNKSGRAGTFRNRVRITDDGLHIDTEAAPDDGSPTLAIATTRAARR